MIYIILRKDEILRIDKKDIVKEFKINKNFSKLHKKKWV